MSGETWNHEIQSGTAEITGTMINYYSVCERKLWLFSRRIQREEDSGLVSLGRLMHQESYTRERKEVLLLNRIKLDHISIDGHLLIHEVKKSRAHSEAARLQLLFYLSEVEKLGIVCHGVLHFRGERRRESVSLDEESRLRIREVVKGIQDIVCNELPPDPSKNSSCRKCAYYDYCF
ncbi:MAG: CRISPR-associated protein Cas4, partial [Candidatus Thorarchaeota archaeon]|nr:CRISPR-associated protein Cas4 [Candidatus Thorarchaeota archaeon]